MNYIGIDYSLNSTGITIKTNSGYKFFNITSTDNRFLEEIKKSNLVEVHTYKKLNYDTEKDKMLRAELITDLIYTAIQPYLTDSTVIAIEGFSFGSTGQSFIDLISAQSFLRAKLLRLGFIPEIYSPKQIKKFYSKNGNADKLFMYKFFIEETDNKLANWFKTREPFTKSGKLLPAVSDLIDSYAIVKLLESSF